MHHLTSNRCICLLIAIATRITKYHLASFLSRIARWEVLGGRIYYSTSQLPSLITAGFFRVQYPYTNNKPKQPANQICVCYISTMASSPLSSTSNNKSTMQQVHYIHDVIQSLQEANNVAATSIANGENLQAFRTVQAATTNVSALAPWMTSLEEESSSLSMSRGQGQVPTARHQATPTPTRSSTANLSIRPLYAAEVWPTEEDHGFVFSCPFVFHPILGSVQQQQGDDDAMMPTLDIKTIRAMSAVAIFNMALACHLQVHVSDDCRKAELLLNRATCLYQQAARLLQNEDSSCAGSFLQDHHHHYLHSESSSSPPPCTMLLQVYLAICNNLIEVAMSTANLEMARFWKSRLDAALEDVPDTCHCGPFTLLNHFKGIQVIYAGTFVASRAA